MTITSMMRITITIRRVYLQAIPRRGARGKPSAPEMWRWSQWYCKDDDDDENGDDEDDDDDDDNDDENGDDNDDENGNGDDDDKIKRGHLPAVSAKPDVTLRALTL